MDASVIPSTLRISSPAWSGTGNPTRNAATAVTSPTVSSLATPSPSRSYADAAATVFTDAGLQLGFGAPGQTGRPRMNSADWMPIWVLKAPATSDRVGPVDPCEPLPVALAGRPPNPKNGPPVNMT